MKNRKFLNCVLPIISAVLTILFVFSNSATASTVDVLKGNDAIKDANNSIVYYKSGVVSNSSGTVNLIKKDQKTGIKTILTKVDAKPFYYQDNYIYYTTKTGIHRIRTDGTNKKQLISLVSKESKLHLLGLNGNYIYYCDYNYTNDTNKMVIARIKVNGVDNQIIRELNDYYTYDIPVLANNMIYYTLKSKNLTSITLDGKTTKIVIKSAHRIYEIKGNRNGLYFIYQKGSTSDPIIRKTDSSGIITNLVTIEKDLNSYIYSIKLYCLEDDSVYYTLSTKIYQVISDGKEHQLLYDVINLNKYSVSIAEIYIKGNWMIIKTDDDGGFSTYSVKKDGSYQIYLGSMCYSNSFDILGNTIYYRVVTIPGDDEDYTYNDENVYRKLTLPLKE
jgi:hypothetical protein